MMDQYITGDLQYVFGPDSLETSRPIVTEVTTNPEIRSMFDSISYEKGLLSFYILIPFQCIYIKYLESRGLYASDDVRFSGRGNFPFGN